MNLEEKTVKQNYIYKGRIINLRVDEAEIPNGAIRTREVIEHSGGVCVVPITDNNEVITVKQFRYPYMEIVTEIPAGKRDTADEEPLQTGIRELKEETGCTADKFIYLGELYPSPGYCGEVIYMYAAKGLHYGETNPDEDEFLEIDKTPINIIVDKILNGEIKDSKTQAAILKVNELIRQGKL